MSIMKVDTIMVAEDGIAKITRLNMDSGIIKICGKFTIDRRVKFTKIGNTYFFPERPFFQYDKKDKKRLTRIVPHWT